MDAIRIAPHLHNVTIKNCFIYGYKKGVLVEANRTAQQRDRLKQIYDDTASDLERRYILMSALDEEIRQTATHDVSIQNVHAWRTGHVGFYVQGHNHDIRFDHISSWGNNDGPGIYLTAGTRDIDINHACVSHSAREGLAIDASFGNVIRNSRFERNRFGGILLYKNANENLEKGHTPRTQHSSGNLITGNLFWQEQRGVWVASRASKDYYHYADSMADPIVLVTFEGFDWHVYRRDFAESNSITKNTFLDSCKHAVVVEDDNTTVSDNYFSSYYNGEAAIFLGSRVRDQLNDPVYGTVVTNNIFDVNIRYNVQQKYCGSGSYFYGNLTDYGSYDKKYSPGSSSCDGVFSVMLSPVLISTALSGL